MKKELKVRAARHALDMTAHHQLLSADRLVRTTGMSLEDAQSLLDEWREAGWITLDQSVAAYNVRPVGKAGLEVLIARHS